MNRRVGAIALLFALGVSGLCPCAFATVTNVSTVAELIGALEYWKDRSTGRQGTVIQLAPGSYDVSECQMTCAFGGSTQVDMKTHLTFRNVTLRGATDNPRDTVIFGGGEAKKRGVICAQYGAVYNLTVSNGWAAVGYGGGYRCYNTSSAKDTMREWTSNCVYTCNYAGGTWCGGGAIAYVEARNCEFVGNSTVPGNNTYGGAAHHCQLFNCFLHDNKSGSKGGALGPCYAYDCIISNNTSTTGGGAIGCNDDCFLLDHCEVVNNTSQTEGGAVSPGSAAGYATNTLFAGNASVGTGGALYATTCYDCVISNNHVEANSSNNAQGAGAYSGKLFHCTVCYNYLPARDNVSAGSSYGAGASACLLEKCDVFGNAVLYGGLNRQGAGLYGCTATNCVVYENFIAKSSNGAAMNGGSAYGCVFSNNQGSVTWGGAPIRQPSGAIVNCDFYAQAIECSTDVLIENCRFHDFTNAWRIAAGHNVASPETDLVGSESVTPYLLSGSIHLRNCLLTGNAVNYFCKAYSKGGTLLENCTIADNRFKEMFYNFNGQTSTSNAAEIVNCIFSRNYDSAGTTRSDISYGNSATNIVLRNCLIGPERSSAKPLLEENTVVKSSAHFNGDSPTDSYEIRIGSPARGRGLVQSWMTGASDIRGDAANYPRLRGSGEVDIGCYQSVLAPVGFQLQIH